MPCRARILLSAVLALATSLACSSYHGSLPVVALQGSATGLDTIADSTVPVKRDSPGSDWAITSVLFVPTGRSPRLDKALERAVENAGGGSVVAARVRTRNWWFGVSVAGLRVDADVAQVVRVGAPNGPGQFSLLSNRRVPPPQGEGDLARRVRGVRATRTVRHYLWVPTRPSPPRLEDAVHEAIAEGGGDLLVDADVEYHWWTLPLLYGVESWSAEGDTVRLPRPEPEESAP